MGAGLPFLVIGVVLFVGIVAVVAAVVTRHGARMATVEDPEVDSLEYRLPTGLDATQVLADVTSEGYDAVEVERDGRQHLVIATPEGRDRSRARLRAVLAMRAHDAEGNPERVRFTDEDGF